MFSKKRTVRRPKSRLGRHADIQTERLEDRQMLAADLTQALFNPTILGANSPQTTTDGYLAIFTTQQDPQTLAQMTGASDVTPYALIPNSFQLQFDTAISLQDAADRLTAIDGFEAMEPELQQEMELRFIPNDIFFGQQWYLHSTGQLGSVVGEDLNVIEAWDNYTGAGVVVGVVDDSLQLVHPDLMGNIIGGASFDFVDNDNDPSPAPTYGISHGTAIAGYIAARGNNTEGISGVAPEAGLVGIRLLSPPITGTGRGAVVSPAAVGSALDYANHSIDVSNNSWGPVSDGALHGLSAPALAALRNGVESGRGGRGTVYVWAAGNGSNFNDNVNYDGYANSRHTIAVAAVNSRGRWIGFEQGAPILVSAYTSAGGSPMITTDPMDTVITVDGNGQVTSRSNEGYNIFGSADGEAIDDNYTNQYSQGTSISAGLVSGVVALMLEANPNLSSRDVQDILVRSARLTDPSDPGWTLNGAGLWVNHKYGFGIVDAGAAVAMAQTHSPLSQEVFVTTGNVSLNQLIPDNGSVISVPLNINGQLNIEHVELMFHAPSHFRGEDLSVTLVSPSGTRSRLATTRFLSGAASFVNYNSWTFTSTHHWGENAQGTWTLEVSDNRNGLSGSLANVALTAWGTELPLVVSATPNTVREDAGFGAAVGTVSRSQFASVANPVDVFLTSSDTTEITVPAVVTIPAGRRSITFPITAVDDTLLDGTQIVQISATLGGFTTSTTISVLDHETISISIADAEINESDGAGATMVTVTRSNTDLFPPDNFVVVANELQQFDATGVLVNTIPVPWPTGARPLGQNVHDMVVLENGKIAVYNGTTQTFVSVYNPGNTTWQHFFVFGLSTSTATTGTGGITAHGDYVFLTDMETSQGDVFGIVRVDTNTGAIDRMGTRSFGNRLFGNSLFGTTLFELNPVNGSVIRSIPFPFDAGGDAGSAFDGTHLYFLHSTVDTIYKVDPDAGTIVDTFQINAVTSGFEGLAYLNGKLYLLDPLWQNEILEFDLLTESLTRRMFVGAINGVNLSGGLAASPTRNTLFVSSWFTGEIYEISPTSGILLSRFNTGRGSEGLAVVGDELYQTSFASNTINVYTLDGVPVRQIQAASGYMSLASDGVQGLVPTSYRYRDTAMGLDGILYALDDAGTVVGKFDPDTMAVLDFVSLSSPVRAITVDADGTIYGAGDSGEIHVFNAEGVRQRSEATGLGVLDDIDLSVTGAILISSSIGEFADTDKTLTTFNSYDSGFAGSVYVSFGEAATRSASAVTVTLTNSDPSEISIPLTVVIPIGESSVTFPLDAVDDNLRDGVQLVTIGVSAPGYISGSDAIIAVHDTEGLELTITADQISENAAAPSTTARLRRTDTDGPYDHLSTQVFAVNTPQTILDNDKIISSVFVPSQISAIIDVDVQLSIQHSWLSDLDVFLVHVTPTGTKRVELFTDILSNGSRMTNTILDDEAPLSILHGSAPFTGRFMPEQPLSAFDGDNPSGQWFLEVTDDNPTDVGTLLSWSLILRTMGLAEATVEVTSSDPAKAVASPTTVVIPANQSEVWFNINAVDNNLLDGTQTVTFTATATNITGFGSGTDDVDVLDHELLTLSAASASILESAGPSATTATVTRNNTDLGSPLVVSLISSVPSRLSVPATVTIPAGQASVTFAVAAIDNNILDGDQTVTITAAAAGYFSPVSVDILVEDVEPSLRLMSASGNFVLENAGTLTLQVERFDQVDISQSMLVTLSSSDTSELIVPATVVIPAGQISVPFVVTVVDDNIDDGTIPVLLTASANGVASGTLTINVGDHETLTVTVNKFQILENAGASAAIGTVTRSDIDSTRDLVVTLTSSDTTELTVPATVTIPAGQASVDFEITAVNDSDLDGPQPVTITVSAINYVTGSVQMTVLDHEPPVISGPTALTDEARPLITWNALPGAKRYDIWIDNLTTGVRQIIRNENVQTTSFRPTESLGIATYLVWVRAYDSLERAGFWSDPYRFRVESRPVITAPVTNSGQAAPKSPVISWTAIPDAVRYDLWLDNATTGQSQLVRRTDLTTTSFQTPTPLASGQYKVWVRALNSRNEPGNWSFGKLFTVLDAPTVVAPQGGTFDRTPTFTWTGVSGATHYDLWVQSTTTREIVLRNQFVQSTSFTAQTDLPKGDFAVWVRAFSNNVFGSWSAPRSFGIEQPPVVTAPGNNVVSGPRPQFLWTSISESERYELWVNRTVNGVTQRVIHRTDLTSTSFTAAADLAVGSYRVWVRAVSNMGVATNWSRVVAFTVVELDAPMPASEFGNGPELAQHTVDGKHSLTLLDQITVGPAETALPMPIDSAKSIGTVAVVNSSTHTEVNRRAGGPRQTSEAHSVMDEFLPVAHRLPAEQTVVSEDAGLQDAVMSDWGQTDWWSDNRARDEQQSQSSVAPAVAGLTALLAVPRTRSRSKRD